MRPALFALLACLTLYWLLFHASTHVPGDWMTDYFHFHWNFWCGVADPLQVGFCRTALERFPYTLVRDYRERDFRYALYRLDFATPSSAVKVP